MQNIYYVEEIHINILDENTGEREVTGNKTIRIYDIDTQTMSLIPIGKGEFQININTNTELYLKEWLKNNTILELLGEENYTLIKL